jgi:hypothetical protein
MIILPPLLASGLIFFDGERTDIELQAYLSRLAGQIVFSEVVRSLIEALASYGLLEGEEFERRRAHRHAEFAAAPQRMPAHAGSAYPDEAAALRLKLNEYLAASNGHAVNSMIGIAAPHVSPEGGWPCYAAAYGRLAPHVAEKTVVILGTSHYGEPEKFGLTRKPFVSPLGALMVDVELVDWLIQRAGDAVIVEDYCHAVEHSIEFQCVFLQQMLGSDFKIVPILCGPFATALLTGRRPESEPTVERFFQALGEMAELYRSRLFWVMGIDLAHIGRRYGDPFTARAQQGRMLEVRERDHARLARVCAGDGAGFFELVKPDHDRLKWCGFPPLYTFLQTVKGARGHVLRYDQWNIDEESVVSFTALEFTAK